MWPQEQFCSLTQVRRPVLQQPFRLSAYVQRACSLRHPARILAGIDPADFICNGISFLFAVPAVMGTAFFYAFFLGAYQNAACTPIRRLGRRGAVFGPPPSPARSGNVPILDKIRGISPKYKEESQKMKKRLLSLCYCCRQ